MQSAQPCLTRAGQLALASGIVHGVRATHASAPPPSWRLWAGPHRPAASHDGPLRRCVDVIVDAGIGGGAAVPLSRRHLSTHTVITARSAPQADVPATHAIGPESDREVRAVAEALQSIIAAATSSGREGSPVLTRAYVTQAVTPLMLAMHKAPSETTAASAGPDVVAWQTALLDAAWRAAGTTFYWHQPSHAAASAVAVPCDWREVIATTALALPVEGVSEAGFVHALQRSLASHMAGTAAAASTSHKPNKPPACNVPDALEGADGSLAHWVNAHFPELVLVTHSARTGECLYRCTAPQRWHIRSLGVVVRDGVASDVAALGPTRCPPLRGPEAHRLSCLHRALEAVHGAGCADAPVWTPLRALMPYVPSSMVCPAVDQPHAWVELLSAPALREDLAVQARIAVRAARHTTGSTRHTSSLASSSPVASAADKSGAAHAHTNAAAGPAYVCVDVTSFLPSSSGGAAASEAQREAAALAARITTRCLTSLVAGGTALTNTMTLVVLVIRGGAQEEMENAFAECLGAPFPERMPRCTYVAVDRDGFLGSEHVLGATVSKYRQQSASQALDEPSKAPDIAVVCRSDKAAAMRAVLEPLCGTVTFYSPSPEENQK